MPYLVDGNNLIGVNPSLEIGSQESREYIIKKLLRFHRVTKKRVILVFDGAPDPFPARMEFSPKNFEVIFPKFGESADDVIRRMLRQGMILVTSDTELIEEARKKRIKWITSRDFWHLISSAKQEGKEKPDWNPTPQEIDAWLKIFEKK